MDQVLWVFAILLTIGVGVAGLFALVYVLNIATKAAATMFGFVAGSLLMLIILTVTDIRFIALFVVIFTILADQFGGGWAWVAFITSCSLFLMSAAYLLMFLTELFLLDESLLEKLTPNYDKATLKQISLSMNLNVGFLGVVYIGFSFFATCYNYFLVSSGSNLLANVFIGPQNVVYVDFLRFSFQKILDSIPFDFTSQFKIALSPVRLEDNAYAFKAFVFVFQFLFYSSLASLIGWLFKGRKLLDA